MTYEEYKTLVWDAYLDWEISEEEMIEFVEDSNSIWYRKEMPY